MTSLASSLQVLLVLVLNLDRSFGDDVPVALFQSSGAFSDRSHMIRRVDLDEEGGRASSYTCCARFFQLHDRGGGAATFLSYGNDISDNFIKGIVTKTSDPTATNLFIYQQYKDDSPRARISGFRYGQWYHVCLTLRHLGATTGDLTLFLDGERIETFRDSNVSPLVPGYLVLGQDQDIPGGLFEEDSAWCGGIAQVGLWDRVLSDGEVMSLANCSSSDESNLASWKLGEWNASGEVAFEKRPLESFCRENDRYVLFPERLLYEQAKHLCDLVGGRIPVLGHGNEAHRTYETLAKDMLAQAGGQWTLPCTSASSPLLPSIWLGQNRRLNPGGDWTDPYGAAETPLDLTFKRAPHAGEDCAYVQAGEAHSTYCSTDFKQCAACRLTEPPPQGTRHRFELKGLCPEETQLQGNFDTRYYVGEGSRNGRMFFRGVSFGLLYFHAVGQQPAWRLTSFRRDDVFLSLPAPKGDPESSYPFGRRSWRISGSDETKRFCGKGVGGGVITLTFSRCFPNMFTCNNGDCIPLGKKCDTNLDCSDESDESSCRYIATGDTSYNRNIIPRNASEPSAPLSVSVSFDVLSVVDIDTMNLKFVADYILTMKWYDSRLRFDDLHEDSSLNQLRQEDKEAIWYPVLIFVNTLGFSHTVVDSATSATLELEEEGRVKSVEHHSEGTTFGGGANAVVFRREYFNEFTCIFDLRSYPFDSQVCSQVYRLEEQAAKKARFARGRVTFSGQRQLVEFEIVSARIVIAAAGGNETELRIAFTRRMEYHVTNTFLQTLLLSLVGYLSFYFPLADFTDRIMVTLTTMLVLATITSTIQQSLPKTSYYKLIDFWLMFSLNTLVFTFMCHTVSGYINYREQTKRKEVGRSPTKRAWTKRKKSKESGGGGGGGFKFGISSSDAFMDSYFSDTTASSSGPADRVDRAGKTLILAAILAFNVGFWIAAMRGYNQRNELDKME